MSNEFKNPKIFIIGFNKTATRSLYSFFMRHGIQSIHWENGNLACRIAENISSFRDPFAGYENFQVFSDMECVTRLDKPRIEAYKYFESFFYWHPTAKFILNTRNVEDWLVSRRLHADGHYLNWYKHHYALDEQGVVQNWRLDFHRHHHRVLEFFKDKPSSLLVYDIDKHHPARIVDFLSAYYSLRSDCFPRVGQT